MHADPSQLSLSGVALATGLEPSHVQFLVSEFREFFPGSGTTVDPRDFDLLRELHRQFFVLGQPLSAIHAEAGRRAGCRILAITSGKGGVGKTTLSVNLAVALAERGLGVLLFDADFGMANAHVYAGVTPTATLLDVIEGRASLAQIVTPGPAGVQMICGASGVARLADLGPATRDALIRELRRLAPSYDVLLIDTGAGIAASVLQLVALAHEMVVVTTPNLAATLDAYGVIKATHEARVPAKVRVLVNESDDEAMAGTVFGRIKGCAERFLGTTPQMLGWLPAEPAFEAANRQRRPLLLANPDSPTSHRVRDLAARLCEPATESIQYSVSSIQKPTPPVAALNTEYRILNTSTAAVSLSNAQPTTTARRPMTQHPLFHKAPEPLSAFQPNGTHADIGTETDPLADLIHPFPEPSESDAPTPRPLSFETDLLRFYGFRENPFADSIHPAFFYRTESHAEAFRNMMLAADFAASLGMVTAPSGTGKTLLTQLLLQHLPQPQYLAILVLVTPGITKTGLLREILSELNVALPVGNLRVQDLVKLLSNHIIDLHEQGQRLVILFDECHLLSGDCLHIVRTISNIEIPTRKLVTCLLFGESRLDQRLTHPSYESLRNRIYLRSTLAPLSAEDVAQFIKFRLIVAGRMTELFTPAALLALHEFSGGIPRTLNKLALLTLVDGAASQREKIDADLVVAQATRL